MTLRKPLPEIARCACGSRAKIVFAGQSYYVRCYVCGWLSAWRKTARGAILAWNRVMKLGSATDAARLTLCYRLIRANRRGGIDAVLSEIDKEMDK